MSRGRRIDWEIPLTKGNANVIWIDLEGQKPLALQALKDHPGVFEFTLPIDLKSGDCLSISIGSPSSQTGNRCQTHTQRKRHFALYLDPKGKGDFKEPELFHVDVRGGPLDQLRVIAPSLVSRNKRFDVIVRFEDAYGNLTSCAPEGTLIDLSYEHLRENLNWKLFVPETGFIALPNLYFNEPGVYRIQLKNLLSSRSFLSPPIRCVPETDYQLYWGLFRGESSRYDTLSQAEGFLRHMRDEKSLQFLSTSPFEGEEETGSDQWKILSNQVIEFNEDERFTVWSGFQWQGETGGEGVRQMMYAKDSKGLLRKKDSKNSSLKKIYKAYSSKDLLSIPCLTLAKPFAFDFKEFDPQFEKVVEIYSSWGSSECTAREGNPFPFQGGKKGMQEASSECSLISALNRGCRFGFVAGGWDHRGPYKPFQEAGQKEYTPGLTAVLVKEHSRAALFEALQNRFCYATTGAKIVLGFTIAGQGMGLELGTKEKPGLEYNRQIVGYAVGTDTLQNVEILRNGKVIHTIQASSDRLDFTFDDSESLSKIALISREEVPPFAYYYLRVRQKDGHMAWGSPIWIDLNHPQTPKRPKKK
jgi:hypothetical protein